MEGACALRIRLGHFRALLSSPPALQPELRSLFPAATACRNPVGDGPKTWRATISRDPARPGRWTLVVGDQVRQAALDDADLLPALERAIMSRVVAELGRKQLLLHAGAVAWRGQGLLLPGASGSGKSTLVAALAQAGCAYVGDDVVVLDPASSRLAPLAKGPSIKRGSRRILAPYYPELRGQRPSRRPNGEAIWYPRLPVAALTDRTVPVRRVVFPTYVPGATSYLEPIARTAALGRLLQQTANLPSHGAVGLGALIALLRAASCYTLTSGQLGEAVALLLDLRGGAGSRAGAGE
jgi:energy-coupling factor transporter ATP-binding protein EcfA2